MIAIADIGTDNNITLQRACESLGFVAAVTASSADIAAANCIILPCGTSFEKGLQQMRKLRLDRSIRAAVAASKPVLGIGTGMQLLMRSSDEGGLFKGMEFFEQDVFAYKKSGENLEAMLPVQHNSNGLFCGIPDDTAMYFRQCSACRECADATATAEWNGRFVAAVQKGFVCGVQFYPHKSGEQGLRLLYNYIKMGEKL